MIEAADVRAVVRPADGSAPRPAAPAAPDGGSAAARETPTPATLREFKETAERAWLVQKLRENAWNISKTAEVIDTPRSNLYKKLEQYAISQDTDA